MKKIVLDDFYTIDYESVIEEVKGEITFNVSFDLDVYSCFHEYCSDKVMNNKKILLEWNKRMDFVKIISASFTLGRISYDDNGSVDKIDSLARGAIIFKQIAQECNETTLI